jgi:5,6-dimethylbenzimidazole synthase
MWLAARVENLGLGWVSLFAPKKLAALLDCPAGAHPIALLCIGPVDKFYDQPMLVEKGWRMKVPLLQVVFEDGWREEEL